MISFELPAIYPITNRELSGLSHAEQIRQLAEAGCRFVQIREKSASSREFYDAVVESLAVAKRFDMKVIVNDRVDIAVAAGADGVHLGQGDLSPFIARQLLGDKAIIGYSTHSVDQAKEAASMPVDHIAIGPVFSTRTKENPDPVIGLAGIERVKEAAGNIPLVAIGGIRIEDIPAVLKARADSVALISALVGSAETIYDRFRHANDLAKG